MRTLEGNSSDESADEQSSLLNPNRNNAAPPPPPPPPPARGVSGQVIPNAPPPSPRPPPSPSAPRQQLPQPQLQAQLRRNDARVPPRTSQAAQQQQHYPPPLPPPLYPPPPPPPPPAICAVDWVLRLRHPGKGTLRMHVAKGMTAYLLSKCIIQATDYSEDSIVGLFGYHNGMFVSLDYLISCHGESAPPDESQFLQKQLYSLYIPKPNPKAPWWHDWRVILGGLVLFFAVVWKNLPLLLHMVSTIPLFMESVWDQLRYFLPAFYHSLVTQPLKETYRYGPAVFGGWEGASLPSICARMTYGDQDFWERNFPDCEAMYLAKESAYLFVGRPLVFLVIVLMWVWIFRQWLWYRALRHNRIQNRDRYNQDRDMIQTYRALQVLFRQLTRMVRVGEHPDRGGRRPVNNIQDNGYNAADPFAPQN